MTLFARIFGKKTDVPVSQPDIKLGHRVRDRLTGLEGFAAIKSVHPRGNVMWAVQPQGSKSTVPDCIIFDDVNLEFIDEGIAGTAVALIVDWRRLPYTFGDEVEDTISGVRGRVKQFDQHLNGCVWVVISFVDKDGSVQVCGMDFCRVAKVPDTSNRLLDVMKTIPSAIMPAPKALPAPGGPLERPCKRI